jgi:acyl-CoA synthetase (AMP-forming)/AMP-acid ligase II/pimeloyl-ACP methyl ester carboxylesterase
VSRPASLPGLDPAWSRWVDVPDGGRTRRWHVLDNGPRLAERGGTVVGTVLCVHGNPTWSYLWRRVLEQAPPGWRVVAPDHLGMGWSERTGGRRGLAQRIDDLTAVVEALEVDGPVVLLAHDWGGPIGLGWALRHRHRLSGVVLTNTAVHQPSSDPVPPAIRLARHPALLDAVCRRTPAFVRAATATCVPPLPAEVRDAFAAPYDTPDRRGAVADFVADIPLEEDHPSAPALTAVRDGLADLADVPVLLVWGPRDPVFTERYLRDLLDRLPHADVHRYAGASHLVLEDRPEGVGLVWDWVTGRSPAEQAAVPAPARGGVPVEVRVDDPDRLAIAELRSGRRITAGELDLRVRHLAAALQGRGVRPGERVAVLVPPGIDLTTLVYALWRLGAVVVVADAGLGLRRLTGALRAAGPDHVVGIRKALALARAGRVPGTRLRFEPEDAERLVAEGAGSDRTPSPVAEDADAAVLFTSGATGPPKGVLYTRDRLAAQVALLRDAFGFAPGDRFVAAFAPFALYGPALGLTSAVPDMDVTAPHTLTARGLAEAAAAIDATVVFAAPAALRNVVATAGDLDVTHRAALSRVRLVLSAGAPVPVSLLRAVKELLPGAATHTPYGMTEAMPVATLDPTTLEATGEGVCVGTPLPGVEVRVEPLEGSTDLGEIVVRGAHTKARYDRLWGTQRASEQPPGWHRTGDVGTLDAAGRLWVQGRLAHVVHTVSGPLAPYPVEHRVEALDGVEAAAVVGVGPVGTQQVVVVVVPEERVGRGRALTTPLAGADLAARVRDAAGVPVSAVLVRDWLPVDIRHASKVDRTQLAAWAARRLHGRAGAPRAGRAPTTRSR